ncbi:hypothetical protein [Mycobacterium tilburgii]|uniref:hypothetical protein n=1 Tax=Mycobacterium tilburgii TaxID=44467 RepID=UPI001643415B|nr:hypothetical protein [Mycobacterium tilburgii]
MTGPERYRWSFMIIRGLVVIGVICNELIRVPQPPNFLGAAGDTRQPASVTSG